ncbi:MAG: hypothetical protein WC443_03815 [Desulfobaccales bacterium]
MTGISMKGTIAARELDGREDSAAFRLLKDPIPADRDRLPPR